MNPAFGLQKSSDIPAISHHLIGVRKMRAFLGITFCFVLPYKGINHFLQLTHLKLGTLLLEIKKLKAVGIRGQKNGRAT